MLLNRWLALPLFSSFILAGNLHAQGASGPRQIVNRAIEALGGEAFLKTREIELHGRFFSFKRNTLTGGDWFADFIKFPDKERTEFGQNKNKTVQINNGSEGWKTTGRGVEEQLPAEVDEFQADFKTSLDYIMRFVITSEKLPLQSLGSEIIDFKRVDVVEFRDAARNRIRLYFDRESGLPVKKQVRRADEPGLREEQYANYHRFQGIMTPMLLTRFTDGEKTMEIRVETAAYDPGLADSLFTQPPGKTTR